MYVATVHNEILYSHDGGATWTQSSPVSVLNGPSGGFSGNSVQVSPTDSSTVFMGFQSPSDTGLYVSHDAGVTWTSFSNQVPGYITDIHFSSSTPLVGYAAGDAGVYKTTNGGVAWTKTSFSGVAQGVTIDPTNADVAYVGTLGGGLYKTTNGGATFVSLNGNIPPVVGPTEVIAVNGALLASVDGLGVFRSTDRGMTWHKTFTNYGTEFLSAASNQTSTVYLSSLVPLGVYRSTDGGNTWVAMTTTEMFYNLAIAPNDADKLIGVSLSGSNILGMSSDGGITWVTSTPISNMLDEGNNFDPFNPSIVYANGYGGGSFYRSLDGGATWATSTTGCADCATALDYLGVSPYTPGLLFASTRNNYVYKSTNYGATWTQTGLLPPAPPNQGWAWSFVFDPHSSSTVYAGDRQYTNAWYKTIDGGATWSVLPVTGYPVSTFIDQLTMDPQDTTRFISGSSQGVYIYENAIPVTASSTFLGSTQATVLYNQSLGYTVTVNNTGYATSSQTQVRITLPANVTISSATWDGVPITPSISGTQAIFSVGDIAPLGTGSLVYHVVIGSSSACDVGLSQSVQVISTEDTQGTAVGQPFTVTIPCPSSSLPPVAYMAPTPPASGLFAVVINGGAITTPSPIVSLSLAGGNNARTMALSNTPDFSGASQEPYAAVASWNICAGLPSCDAGLHTIYAKFYTSWGVASSPISASITLVPVTPIGGISSPVSVAIGTASSSDRVSIEERLTALQAQLAYLLSQTHQLSGTTPAVSVDRFTKNLSLGMTDAQVKLLQQVLNRNADTRVASAGAGSPGHETDYFGPATKRAVSAFQEKYRSAILVPGGYAHPTGMVGPATRAKLNSLIGE